jgi:hypothetical protein
MIRQPHDFEFEARYEPDVFSGTVCHPDLGFHKHAPTRSWEGVVIGVPLAGDELVVRVVGNPFVRMDQ